MRDAIPGVADVHKTAREDQVGGWRPSLGHGDGLREVIRAKVGVDIAVNEKILRIVDRGAIVAAPQIPNHEGVVVKIQIDLLQDLILVGFLGDKERKLLPHEGGGRCMVAQKIYRDGVKKR